MKAYLFCSPEFSFDTVKEVATLLNIIPGKIEFGVKESLPPDFYKNLNVEFECIDENSELSFDELFRITRVYRSSQRISDNDFVILITSIRNDQQWFSAFNKKDIFIHGAEWDLVSNIDSKFELAYQCVENIFQSLMDLKVDKYHDPSIGCINDLCLHKPDILLKLQTGNICPACIQKSNEMGIENSIIKQIHTIINRIRVEFVLTLDYFNNVQLDPVEVDEKGKIKIGDKPIKLDFLPRVMYITFLMNPDGILSSEKCEKYNLFLEVSELLKPTKDDHEKKSRELSIKKMCCRRFVLYNVRYNDPPTFETYRSKIKTALKKALGENNSKLYCISLTEDNVFTINLREELVRLPEELNNQ